MTVCFTGHRDLGSAQEELHLRGVLDLALDELIGSGASVFRAGGALGFDTVAAVAVLQKKKLYPHIRLELLLPCPDQCARWNDQQIFLYNSILSRADSHVYLSDHYFRGVMHKRNRALVDGADLCVAFLREGASGGTAYTVDYAKHRQVPVRNLFEEL